MAERGQLPKAYLRLDPNADAHPDLDAMVRFMCWANRQPDRGRFKTLDVMRKLIGRKRLQACIDRGDVEQIPDGRWLLVAWDDWQEGDLTVGERVARLRDRRRYKVTNGTVTSTVTKPLPPSEALGVDVVRNNNGNNGSDANASGGEPPPTPATPAQAREKALSKLGPPKRGHPTWLSRPSELWHARWGMDSEVPFGEMGKAFEGPFKAFEARGELEEFWARWERFLAAAKTSQLARPIRFIQGLGEWSIEAMSRAGPSRRRNIGEEAIEQARIAIEAHRARGGDE